MHESQPVEVPVLSAYRQEPQAGCMHGGTRLRATASRMTGESPVSVVTVVRNGAATLERAIRSVMAQDYPAVEHIVIDGASTDGTLDVIRKFDKHIAVWLSEKDKGISDAFNKGIALAHGEIVGLLNSDDWYESGAVTAVVSALQTSGADIAYGNLQYWERGRKTFLVESEAALLDRGMTLGHPAVFVRRSCFERFGLFQLDFRQAMDYEWLLRAKVEGARFVHVNRCLANMQSGGLGDKNWCRSQMEVGRARSLHLSYARGWFAYGRYVAFAIAKGVIRRSLDAAGLGMVRDWYHRNLSRVRVRANRA